jgi:hypothetical protein
MLRRLLAILALAGAACGVSKEYAAAWEGRHRSTFLPGYTDYRGEADMTDNGYVIMNYAIPPEVPTEQVIERVQASVGLKSACYSVLEKTATFLVMRCPRGVTPPPGMWDEEYEVLVKPSTRRVFVLAINSVEPATYSQVRQAFMGTP